MQLKNLAKVSEVTIIINKTYNKFSNIPNDNLAKNKVIIDALTKSTQGYSNGILIAIVNYDMFTEAQARQILQTTTLDESPKNLTDLVDANGHEYLYRNINKHS